MEGVNEWRYRCCVCVCGGGGGFRCLDVWNVSSK